MDSGCTSDAEKNVTEKTVTIYTNRRKTSFTRCRNREFSHELILNICKDTRNVVLWDKNANLKDN
jgi:hypothetical protein